MAMITRMLDRPMTRRQALKSGAAIGLSTLLDPWRLSISPPLARAQVGRTYNVGPSRTYTSLFNLYNSVTIQSGDTILIDGGTTYVNELFQPRFGAANIQLGWSGVGATKPVLQGGNRLANNNDKGLIWVSGGGWVIEDLEITNATATGGNGAPISFESANGATVRRCLFRNNQLGMRIIDNCTGSAWLFEHNEFRNNGIGDGYTHNFYCQSQNVTELVFQYNYSHDCNAGHLFKSRARVNKVLYNRLEEGSVACNACLDTPYGGTLFLIGNILQKRLAGSGRWHVVWWGETPNNNGMHEVYAINNTFRHEHTGTGWVVFAVSGQAVTFESRNNVVFKSGSAITLYQTGGFGDSKTGRNPSIAATNVNTTSDPGFESAANMDFRLLASATSLINQGSSPQIREGFDTTPTRHYVHVASQGTRPVDNPIDIGAYEFVGSVTAPRPPTGLRVRS